MTSSTMLATAALLAALAVPAIAQKPALAAPVPMVPGHTMPGLSMPTVSADASPSTKAFKAADEKMMKDMNRPMTGNADQDFVAGMLPHHAGAIDLARVELQYG